MSNEPAQSRPAPAELLPWALSIVAPGFSGPQPRLAIVAGDASNRRYFRLEVAGASHILVEAPPSTEKNEAFLAVRDMLADAGIRVPASLGADLQRGFLLLEDLGDRLLLQELSPELAPAEAHEHYRSAFGALRALAAVDCTGMQWPRYDAELLAEELGRFPSWFAGALLEYELPADELDLFLRLSDLLIASALEQPRVLVHRDFHSRNLMPQPDGRLGVIDFQDAVIGPITYDPVSLLRDCYIRWPRERVAGWALEHYRVLLAAGLLGECGEAQFLRWFDWMGLQRHLKVLGTFARLHLRDGKPGYLDDLPLVLRYVRETLEHYSGEQPVFAGFGEWFDRVLGPRIEARALGVQA